MHYSSILELHQKKSRLLNLEWTMRVIENQNKDGASYKVIVANFLQCSGNRNSLKCSHPIAPPKIIRYILQAR